MGPGAQCKQQLIRGGASGAKSDKNINDSFQKKSEAMAEKEKDDTDKYLHKLEKKISGKLKKTDKNKKSLKRLLDCLREERKKTKDGGEEGGEAGGGSVITATETTNVKTIAIDLKEGKQRIQLINSLISKSGESSKKKEAKAKRKLEAAKSKADKMVEVEEGGGDVEEILSRPGSSRSKCSAELALGSSSRKEMDAKRLDSSESRIRSFESFARSSSGTKGEKSKKEPPKTEKDKSGRLSIDPFPEEKEGGFLDRVVPGKAKSKARRDDDDRERERAIGTYKDRDMMVEDEYEELDYRDQEMFWPAAAGQRGPGGREDYQDQKYSHRGGRGGEYRGWEEDRGLRGRREDGGESHPRERSSWGFEGTERRRPRPRPLSPHPPSSSSRLHHPSILINPHHPSNRSYVPPHEETWERGSRGYERRRREDYREEGRRRDWEVERRGRREEIPRGGRGERYWAYEDEEEDAEVEEDKLSEDDADFAATGCRRANDEL